MYSTARRLHIDAHKIMRIIVTIFYLLLLTIEKFNSFRSPSHHYRQCPSGPKDKSSVSSSPDCLTISDTRLTLRQRNTVPNIQIVTTPKSSPDATGMAGSLQSGMVSSTTIEARHPGNKSNLTHGHRTEESALDEVLNMFDLDARGY